MKRAKFSLSTEDFGSFAKVGADNKKPIFVKSITQIGNKTEMNLNLPSQQIDFRNMVRAIVGTMVEIGSGKLKPADLRM